MARVQFCRHETCAASHKAVGTADAFLRRVLLGVIALAFFMTTGPTLHAEAPPERLAILARGINLAHWFRWPPTNDVRAMRGYLDDAAAVTLKRLGFTYVRLAIGPEEVMRGDRIEPTRLDAILHAVERLTRAGLGVMVEPHPQQLANWNLEQSAEARQRVLGFWRDLAPKLARFPAALVFPELVNEPVYQDPAAWDRFQEQLLQTIRAALPWHTIVLTGTDWSSIDGLLRVWPVADPNVVYSFHSYEPQLLTLLASWEAGVDQDSLGRIPFPVRSRSHCEQAAADIGHGRTADIAHYWCSERHDAATVAANLQRAADWGRRHRISVVLTEFGAVPSLNEPARTAYFAAVRRAAEQQGLGWALWALDDSMGFGVPPGGFRAGSALSPGILAALGLTAR